MAREAREHWDAVYGSRPVSEVSWYEQRPSTSLRLLAGAVRSDAAVIDVGAGASFLVDALLDAGWSDLTVLDVSSRALDVVRRRLGDRAPSVSFVAADLATWRPARQYDAWHDRAVFHFLVDRALRDRYVTTAAAAVRPGGAVVLGTFAEDGPTRCSGLPVARYGATGLCEVFGASFDLEHGEREEHLTPGGAVQPLTWVVLRRRPA